MTHSPAPGFIRTTDCVDLFYRDWGSGAPVLFVGGWSLPSDAWNYQMLALSRQGLRCIAFDRRGHGRSSDPGKGYDFDTLAGDLAAVIDTLDLHGVTLVAHSMGCNEVVRYLSRFGGARVARIVLMGPMTPMIMRSDDNPQGLDGALFEFFREQQLNGDFPRWIDDNALPFLTPDASPGMVRWLRQLALACSHKALHDCHVAVQHADMREELARVALPALIIAGVLDVSAPLELTARPTAALIEGARLAVYDDAAHGMFVTHAARVNADLLEFIGAAA
ncbi:alpha/beta hydrolase [Massilia sp. P8910]|uniref:Alpha/beta hydrolase n=1 Tax=Massilia antarctica TaxID=2765360 RepID=A0AA49A934_9BURK|nr:MULTISPECIES: alpha/beta hydrolase [Massilia]CUI06061.1 Non-heme chloroperoxidase [Janthinobacterium sp. CG23_2]MCE3603456.1 alpha/beta hydrolase [Massilia antarctica]MCY0913652.1 alpha/beta hydrolase [Massilia sp. H27-R4]QPI51198.1 alpha/beta hydrolase [Massilia antarctica]CUU29847.1 Non-heme chloroperoxidase [Janthinobacterium sp. CG23_2]